MVRVILIVAFASILVALLAVTSYSSLDRSIFALGSQLTSDPWFQTTLVDTYFGLLTFYFWVAYKEARVSNKLLWFVLVMTLGNIATSIYMLIQLRGWDAKRGAASLLLRADPMVPRTKA